MDKIAHFCQKCRAANDLGEISCRKCGTRLMIVTFPPSLRLEAEMIPPSYYEDHLLERVTLLEFRLKQVSEQLAMADDFISRQSEMFETNNLLISSFLEVVGRVEPKLSERLQAELSENYDKRKKDLESENKQKKDVLEILAAHQNPNAELFSHLVQEGIRLLDKAEEKQAFRTLERAALLSSSNIPLYLFVAKELFAAGKFETAEQYLSRVFELSPRNIKAMLLLGVICADRYESETARKMLSVLARFPEKMVCANYVWGMLAASEQNWKEAIVAFKETSEAREIPEINYLIGCAYFQSGNLLQALEFLERSVEKDQKFADAWYMVSVIYKILEQNSKSERACQMAFEATEAGAQCLRFLNQNKIEQPGIALPFSHLNQGNQRLLSNGSLRMTRFFLKLVFDSYE